MNTIWARKAAPYINFLEGDATNLSFEIRSEDKLEGVSNAVSNHR